MIEMIQNAPGLVPVIINIQPIANLPMFLGLVDTEDESPLVDYDVESRAVML